MNDFMQGAVMQLATDERVSFVVNATMGTIDTDVTMLMTRDEVSEETIEPTLLMQGSEYLLSSGIPPEQAPIEWIAVVPNPDGTATVMTGEIPYEAAVNEYRRVRAVFFAPPPDPPPDEAISS